MARPLKVCICGGGGSAHIIAVLAAAQPDTEVNVLSLYEDEAEQWSKAIEKSKMVLTITGAEGSTHEVKSKPSCVSKDVSSVVPGSDLIIFCVPAFAHEQYLKAISAHLDKKTVIVGLPGHPGFEYQCKSLLGDLTEQITLMSYPLAPWRYNILEYGLKAEVLRTSKLLNGSILRGKAIPRKPPLMSLQMMLGFHPVLKQVKHFIEIVFTSYSFLHPVIMYCHWKDWDGNAVSREPLFFVEIDEETVSLLEQCSKEYQNVAHAISAQKPAIDLTESILDIYNWIVEDFYKDDVEDGSSLLVAIRTNKAYAGIVHPLKKKGTKFVPDFRSRYLSEDIPAGMVVVRGIAEILGVEMPACDSVITWGQEKLGKQYIIDNKLTGPDVKETRAPQAFGFTTLDEILSGRKNE